MAGPDLPRGELITCAPESMEAYMPRLALYKRCDTCSIVYPDIVRRGDGAWCGRCWAVKVNMAASCINAVAKAAACNPRVEFGHRVLKRSFEEFLAAEKKNAGGKVE